jgi:hypothetical protein
MVSRGCDWADVGYYARQGSKRPPTAPGGWCNASSRQSKERFGVPRARPSETTSNATDFGRELREARNDDTETMLPTRDPAGGGCEDVRRPTAWCRTDCTCNAPIAARLVSSLTAMAPFTVLTPRDGNIAGGRTTTGRATRSHVARRSLGAHFGWQHPMGQVATFGPFVRVMSKRHGVSLNASQGHGWTDCGEAIYRSRARSRRPRRPGVGAPRSRRER